MTLLATDGAEQLRRMREDQQASAMIVSMWTKIKIVVTVATEADGCPPDCV